MKILASGQYYGDRKSEYKIEGIGLSEYDYHVPKTDWHYHENPYFMYVLDGKLFDISKKEKRNCSNGTLFFHNWQEQHCNEKYSEKARGFHIEFDRTWLKNKDTHIKLWEGSESLQHPLLHQIVAQIYYEFKKADQFSAIGIESLLLCLCENINKSERDLEFRKPEWVDKLKSILNDTDEKVNLKSLSKSLDVHPVHISRTAHKYLGTSLGEYLRQTKIKKSISLLSNRTMQLTEVGYQCGFYDQSHFTRVFKSYFGITPKQFRLIVA